MLQAMGRRIESARRRLRLERLFKGLAIILAFLLLGSILSSYFLVLYNFSEAVVLWARIAAVVLLLGLLLKVLIPSLRQSSPRQVARFLEERHPQLQEGLSTAVGLREGKTAVDPQLQELLERDVWEKLRRTVLPTFYRVNSSLLSLLTVVASILLFAYLFFGGSEAFQYSLSRLVRSWDERTEMPLYAISVSPGSTTVAKHADMEIQASLIGFSADSVRLQARYENDPAWQETLMRPDMDSGDLVFLFFDVREAMDYYVEADGIQSDTFRVTVSELPNIEELQVRLVFPRYTGLKSRNLVDEGDIEAVVGTRVELTVRTDQPVEGGLIRLEKGGDVALEKLGPQQLQADLKVARDDYYRVHLQSQEEVWYPASDEFLIRAVEDQPPLVSFKQPGRDERVTNIQEIFAEVKVQDDYGIRKTSIHFSVNGESEQEVELDRPSGSRSFVTSHIFYLEEFRLAPGDFVSYYAQAADAISSSVTDIFFLEVEPYDREYYQSQNPGMAMPASGNEDLKLSKRQKEIIVATFKLRREKDRSRPGFEEDVQTLALVQQRLQGQTQTLIDRLELRRTAAADRRFEKMADHLKQAVQHMEPAHDHLSQSEPEKALPEEQKAFQQLLRAEALFKEIQVSFSQNQAGSPASTEELADLVDLELDRTKNQYETLQQNQQFTRERKLDEALEKLRELARRQEQLAERRRRQSRQSSATSNMSQQQLMQEVDELARQLERLSRQKREPQLSETSRRLREAARQMRQPQSGKQSKERLQMLAERALERLREAQGALGRQRQNQRSDSIRKLKEDGQKLEQRQQEVLDKLDELKQRFEYRQVDQETINDLRRLLREKARLQEDLFSLESELHRSARQLESKEPAASRKLKQAGHGVRDNRIPEKMQEGSQLLSRGWVDMARDRETGVAEELGKLSEQLGEAEEALGSRRQPPNGEGLREAREQVGELVEALSSLQQRASQSNAEKESRQASLPGKNPQDSEGNQEGQSGKGKSQGKSGKQGQPSSSMRRAGGLPNTSGVDPGRFQREWQERMREAHSLRGLLSEEPALRRDLTSLIRRMKELDLERLFLDPEEIDRLKSQVISGFHQLELEIDQALEDESGQLRSSFDQDEVPPAFRDQVEEYYKRLSRER